MQHDDEMAGEAAGEWVAVLGFSQGAKVAASLLFDQQAREAAASGSAESNWRFAVILAGRAPLVSLSPATADIPNLATAAQVSNGWEEIEADDDARHVLRLPTVHVHGLQDPGLHLHRRLFRQYCAPGSATLVEWDGIHRVPFKSADIQKVTEAILDVARRTGVIEKDAVKLGRGENATEMKWTLDTWSRRPGRAVMETSYCARHEASVDSSFDSMVRNAWHTIDGAKSILFESYCTSSSII